MQIDQKLYKIEVIIENNIRLLNAPFVNNIQKNQTKKSHNNAFMTKNRFSDTKYARNCLQSYPAVLPPNQFLFKLPSSFAQKQISKTNYFLCLLGYFLI